MTAAPRIGPPVARLLFWGLLGTGLLYGLSHPLAGLPPVGTLLDPLDGLYRTARLAEHPPDASLILDALDGPVTVLRDERGVPHIFAESDRDAIVAMGYAVAQDRLFQIDFLPRVAAGRLSEIFGPASLGADRFLRRTGMDWGARKNVARMQAAGGIERDLIAWFAAGVNAYVDRLAERDLPFEFRLFGYRPERYTQLHAMQLLQYFAYDLSFRTDAASYYALQERLGAEDYARLYPRYARLFVPIVPTPGSDLAPATIQATRAGIPREQPQAGRQALSAFATGRRQQAGTPAEGFLPGKGSNNWAVDGAHSTTGAPILAGDMHLSLTLPAIWYEVHLVTPTMNTYGVTTPGTPLPIEAFNDYLAWAFTNTDADVVDHYALELDETGTRYRYDGAYRALEMVPDTIVVKGGPPVIDTLYYAHWGPVVTGEDGAVATRWVAHDTSRTMQALWEMNHARSYADFESALRSWDTPMQNILYAGVDGTIAIRSTGTLPIRRAGHGAGLLDGSTDAFDWIGRVPFDALPHAVNPAQGFLTSSNQPPADSTYPYYLRHDWPSSYRSLRIDTLLRSKPRHAPRDVQRYQADVHAVQRDLFVPLLDTLTGLAPRADTLRRLLVAWDGRTGVERAEPLVLDEFLKTLHALAWDEPVFDGLRRPRESILYSLLRTVPASKWLDVQATEGRETAAGLIRLTLEATADTLAAQYGWGVEHWRWGDHHKIVFRHLTQSPALRALWRGPIEYPGFAATLSPAGARTTTHSASWRVVVDLSQSPPVGFGVYPGGQSGHPFSSFYDLHVPDYVAFRHYVLHKPNTPEALDAALVSSRLTLVPSSTE